MFCFRIVDDHAELDSSLSSDAVPNKTEDPEIDFHLQNDKLHSDIFLNSSNCQLIVPRLSSFLTPTDTTLASKDLCNIALPNIACNFDGFENDSLNDVFEISSHGTSRAKKMKIDKMKIEFDDFFGVDSEMKLEQCDEVLITSRDKVPKKKRAVSKSSSLNDSDCGEV